MPLLRRPASLIMIGSKSGGMGPENRSVYGATKAALRSLACNISVELSADNIRCNVLSHDFIHTPLLELIATPEGKARFGS